MTRLMQRYFPMICAAYVFNLQHIDKKLRELIGARRKRFRSLMPIRILGEQLLVEDSYHAAARARWRHDVLAFLEDFDEPLSKLASFAAEAAIKRRLPAASLLRGKINFNTELAQHGDHAHPDLREELIHQTGNEQRHSHLFLSAFSVELWIKQQRKKLSTHGLSRGNWRYAFERRIIGGRHHSVSKHIDHRGTPWAFGSIRV